jgi:hypothetical protein
MPSPRLTVQVGFDAREAARQAAVIAKHFSALAAELDGQERPGPPAGSGWPTIAEIDEALFADLVVVTPEAIAAAMQAGTEYTNGHAGPDWVERDLVIAILEAAAPHLGAKR